MLALVALLACDGERPPAGTGDGRDLDGRVGAEPYRPPEGTAEDTADTDTGDTGETGDTGTAETGDTDTAAVPYVCPRPEEETACVATFESSVPADETRDASPDVTLIFTLTEADPLANAMVDGVPGRVRVDGRRVFFTPDAPFAPSTSYVARLCTCDGEVQVDFRTGVAAGTPVADPTDLAGRTWRLDLATSVVEEPAGLDVLLSAHLRASLLVGVETADPTALAVRLGWTDPDAELLAQDVCVPTADASADFAGNPRFALTADTAAFPVLAPTTAEDVRLTGTYSPDGEAVHEATWSGLVDTRPWAALIDPADPSAFCALLPSLGAACEACGEGNPVCLRLTLAGMEGEELTPFPIAPIAATCSPED